MPVPQLDALMRRQHGLITRTQLLRVVTDAQLRTLIRNGRLTRVHHGVYRATGSPLSGKALIMAAVLATGRATWASHTSALYLHSLATHMKESHVTVTSGSIARRGIQVHRAVMPSEHCFTIDRIPVTNAARTLIDSAAVLSEWPLRKAANEAVVRRLCSYSDIANAVSLVGSQGRAGAAIMRKVISEHLPLPSTTSRLVIRFTEALEKARLPMPTLEYWVQVNGRDRFIDAAWPSLMLAVEMDDFSSHAASRRRFDDDRRRNNGLTALGWTVIHLTATMTNAEMVAAVRPFLLRR